MSSDFPERPDPSAPRADHAAEGAPQDLRRATAYCTYCPKLCRHSCPVADTEKRETVTPQAKMQTLHHVQRRELPLTREIADVFYRCTGCLRERTYCKHGTEVDDPLFQGRALAVERGVEPEALADFEARFAARRQKLAAALRKRLPRKDLCIRPEPPPARTRGRRGRDGRPAEDAEGLAAIPTGSPMPEVLVFPGCVQISDRPDALSELVALLRRLDLGRVAVFAGNDPCNGFPFLTTGRPGAFSEHARAQRQLLAGARLIVATCPACVHTLRVVYPQQGLALGAEVLHVSELLARHADRLGLERQRRAIYYHDPCYLGRHLGVYEAPRALVRAAGELHELSHHHADALCSGGGGAVPLTAPDTAAGIAERCLRIGLDAAPEAPTGEPAGGADGQAPPLVVTGCPQAARMLRGVQLAAAGRAAEVRDLVSLVSEASRPPDDDA